MSLTLERGFGGFAKAALAVVLAATMAAAMVALFPAAAEAQTQTEDEGARSVVVRPGDSLWSISEELLGPDATPRRVMNGAKRVHALNRARIGADPDLIIVGRELTIPRSMSEPHVAETRPLSKIAEASDEGAPRRAPRQGAIPRPEASPEEAAERLETNTKGKEALLDPRAVARVPAVRMAVSNDARPGSLFGVPPDAVVAPVVVALLAAALLAAYIRRAARRKARDRELWFRETYGRPYAAFDPSASHGGASRWVSEVRGQATSSDGPTDAGAALEDRSDRTGPSAVARAKRARVLRRRPLGLRQQPPQLRARGSRQPVRARPQRSASSGHQRTEARTGHEEWEPNVALVGALWGLPLCPGTDHGDSLARIEPQLKEALGALGRLERRRGLSESEKARRGALTTLMMYIERAE